MPPTQKTPRYSPNCSPGIVFPVPGPASSLALFPRVPKSNPHTTWSSHACHVVTASSPRAVRPVQPALMKGQMHDQCSKRQRGRIHPSFYEKQETPCLRHEGKAQGRAPWSQPCPPAPWPAHSLLFCSGRHLAAPRVSMVTWFPSCFCIFFLFL